VTKALLVFNRVGKRARFDVEKARIRVRREKILHKLGAVELKDLYHHSCTITVQRESFSAAVSGVLGVSHSQLHSQRQLLRDHRLLRL
jgi:hypothetical protein